MRTHMARRGAALVAGAAGVWLLAGPLGLVLAAALVAVVWLEVYTDAGLGS